MNPDAHLLWRGPRWMLAVLLASLSMLAPFTIDTYLPAFSGIAKSIGASPVEMQQTLSANLFGFALMNLFHGALSDRYGRRPVVLVAAAIYALASIGCATSTNIGALIIGRALQGMSAGAGVVVSRAVIRDMFAPVDAQRVMSQVTIFFGVAPAIAPILGGYLFVHVGWRSIFWFLAVLGVLLGLAVARLLPETLHESHRQSLHVKNLMRGYWQLGANLRFLALCIASGVPFNGMFIYIMSAPSFLGENLALRPEQFFWLFLCAIGGIVGGAYTSGKLAGRIKPRDQIRHGFLIMLAVAMVNVGLNAAFEAQTWWALPIIGLYSFGWALVVPVVTLLALDVVPERRGMASSLQAFIASVANGLVAGVVAPIVMHSALALAVASMVLMFSGLASWLWVKPRLAR